MIWVCPTTPHNVLITPATAIIVGSNPIIGNTAKNGIFDIGPNQACLKKLQSSFLHLSDDSYEQPTKPNLMRKSVINIKNQIN